MREANLQTIREACIKANPEIMELKFGCKVRMFGRVMTWVHLASHTDGTHTPTYLAPNGTTHNSGTYTTQDIENIVILGRPIRLADVLLAIGYEHLDALTEERRERVKDLTVAEVVSRWYLRSDDLTEQSDSTLEFISNLLS